MIICFSTIICLSTSLELFDEKGNQNFFTYEIRKNAVTLFGLSVARNNSDEIILLVD